jgi:serine/threonine protein kinase
MAEVFAGHSMGDHGFQKPVAIKRLLPELANDHVFVERLIGEAKLLVGMQHGNVVSVLDLARDGDDVFLVMEFVDGPSLRQLLKSRGQRGLPLGVATYVVQAAAAGLEFAHNRPGGAIIHADISPSNILLTTSGEVRVADFGIARREGGGHGIVEGKWAYMAPEQARGEPLAPRSDVFALGVVLYELICGAHPFGRQVTAEERDSEPMRVIPPRVVRPSIPPGIDAICMKALAHDPRHRYARMQHLIDAINEERFSNQWRDGASDLATAIRECSPQSSVALQPRTMVTDRPVTIATRSLIRELTPARASVAKMPVDVRGSRADVLREGASRRSSDNSLPSVSQFATGSAESYSQSESYVSESYASESRAPRGTPMPPLHDSGARTNALVVDDVIQAARMMELPPMLRADGTPLPPFKLTEALAPGQDLASVIGGHTHSQHIASQVIVEGRSPARWTIVVLLIAAVIGAIAAIAIARGGGEDELPGSEILFVPPKIDVIAPPPAPPGPPRSAEPPPADIKTPVVIEEPKPADPVQPIDTKVEGDKPVEPPAPVKPTKPSTRQGKKVEPGILRANSDPWSYVTVAGQRQSTVAKFTLPPGKYSVVFESESGRKVVKSAVVESGKVKTVTANMDEDF